MKKATFLAIFFILPFTCFFGQENVSVSRKDFRNDQPGFDAAWKHVRDGDSFYSEGGTSYGRALDEYRLAYGYNKLNAALNYKMGVCALFSDRKEEAADYFGKAYGLNNEITDDILLLYGRALLYAGHYTEAESRLNAYLKEPVRITTSNLAFAKRLIEQCRNGLLLTKDSVRVEIRNIGGNINSNADDYSPVLSPDGTKMYFATRRLLKNNRSGRYKDNKFDENIFVSERSKTGWGLAAPAGKKLITEYCEVPVFMDNTGSLLYIYQGFKGNGDISVSEFRKGEWGEPQPENFGINTDKGESSFAIAPSGKEIAFVSDRSKGLGGKDIYFMERNGRKWKKPENAGDSINSPNDEESVHYSKGGDTLWFSSRGHNTLGGFDIFYSVRRPDGFWSKAVNAGFPLNTAWNELYFVTEPGNDSTFYFASDRSGGIGGLDIYSGRFLPPPPPMVIAKQVKPVATVQKHDSLPSHDTLVLVRDTVIKEVQAPPVIRKIHDTILVRDTVVIYKQVPAAPVATPVAPKQKSYFLRGKVTDSENGSAIIAKVDVIDDSTGTVVATTASSDADGTYSLTLHSAGKFTADIRSNGYLSDVRKFTMGRADGGSFTLNVPLAKVKVGKKVVMKNIFFEAGKSILTPGSYAELDKLVKILEDNPAMKIEISGHTDNTGSLVVNAKLSTERARAVVEYISAKGIERARLTYVGYGSEQPVADNSTEAGRAKNRRVEFKILEF